MTRQSALRALRAAQLVARSQRASAPSTSTRVPLFDIRASAHLLGAVTSSMGELAQSSIRGARARAIQSATATRNPTNQYNTSLSLTLSSSSRPPNQSFAPPHPPGQPHAQPRPRRPCPRDGAAPSRSPRCSRPTCEFRFLSEIFFCLVERGFGGGGAPGGAGTLRAPTGAAGKSACPVTRLSRRPSDRGDAGQDGDDARARTAVQGSSDVPHTSTALVSSFSPRRRRRRSLTCPDLLLLAAPSPHPPPKTNNQTPPAQLRAAPQLDHPRGGGRDGRRLGLPLARRAD